MRYARTSVEAGMSRKAGVALVALVAVVLCAAQAQAGPYYGAGVSSFAQGMTRAGGRINPAVSNPAFALGVPDAVSGAPRYVTLGLRGAVVIAFPEPVAGSVVVYESEFGGSGALEQAQVFGSSDGASWTLLGTAANRGAWYAPGVVATTIPISGCVTFIKVFDVTDASRLPGDGDGFDLDAIGVAEPCSVPVEIDVKPGSDENPVNLKSKGRIPVAILTTPAFDASRVDPGLALFAGAGPAKWSREDADGDGDVDLLLHFQMIDLLLDGSATSATLTGRTFDGLAIEGSDKVTIVH